MRFYTVDEMTELLQNVSDKITIIPVGKRKVYFEDDLINLGLGSPENIKKSFDFHKMHLLEISERLLCIADLQ